MVWTVARGNIGNDTIMVPSFAVREASRSIVYICSRAFLDIAFSTTTMLIKSGRWKIGHGNPHHDTRIKFQTLYIIAENCNFLLAL